MKVERDVVKIEHGTVAELHCSKPYRDRRVLKSVIYLVGSMLYLCTMAGFTIYYSRADFECKEIYRVINGYEQVVQAMPFPLTFWLAG
jgi:hypothetical protein